MDKYKLSETADGSNTLHNLDFEEDYHSRAGAWQEARIKYFDACRIHELSQQNNQITIFELGFGLGFNLIPILDLFQDNPNMHIRYISCEFDSNLFNELRKQKSILYPLKYIDFFDVLLRDKVYDDEWLSVEIIEDDVRRFINKLQHNSIDAIYHDPFSPYKNTECWTKNLFDQYFLKMKDHAILSTYSMSTPVRSGFYQAGFYLWEGVGDQKKQTGTIVTKTNLNLINLSSQSFKKLHNSPERIPFIDEDLNLDRDQIKGNRQEKKDSENYGDITRFPMV